MVVDYFGFRYYMPAIGRWTTVDPPADSFPSWSPYNYVYNNPVTYTDPFGLCPKCVGKIISLGVRGFKTLAKNVDEKRLVQAVREGDDVIVRNQQAARRVAREAGDGRAPVGPEVHRPEVGNRPHYHAAGRQGGHVFYSAAAALTFSHYAQDSSTGVKIVAGLADFVNPLSILNDIADVTREIRK